jgi:hypothetical protein
LSNCFGVIKETCGVQQIEPFFVLAGTEEGFFGGLKRLQTKFGEQVLWKSGFEQSACVGHHIERPSR